MSGLIPKTHSDAIYLSVKHHSICEESKTARDGFEQITTRNPKTDTEVVKWIRQYDGVGGYATKLEWYDRTDEASGTRFLGYKLHMDAMGVPVVLDLPFKSRPFDTFTQIAENINWSKPVTFRAWHDRREDKTAFVAMQDGAYIKFRYTRENPGEGEDKCPPPVHDEVDGWDFRERRKWLKHRMDSHVVPIIARANEHRLAMMAQSAPVSAPDPDDYSEYDDGPDFGDSKPKATAAPSRKPAPVEDEGIPF